MTDIDAHEDTLLSRREMLERTGKMAVGGALAIALGGLATTGNAGIAEAATKTKYVASRKICKIEVSAFSSGIEVYWGQRWSNVPNYWTDLGTYRFQVYQGRKKIYDGHTTHGGFLSSRPKFETDFGTKYMQTFSRTPTTRLKIKPNTSYTIKICVYEKNKKTGTITYGPWRSASFKTPKKGRKSYKWK